MKLSYRHLLPARDLWKHAVSAIGDCQFAGAWFWKHAVVISGNSSASVV
ncbi:hypothetical protein HX037_02110 [Ignatzschineria indica]|nr:hypothetical protein [Ignatzschineria indica]MDM1544682.1 hypothetical protein [Ignatzschineria indica]